jgi:hypothetical protein
MPKDKRYTTVKNLIGGGYIKSFEEIFDTIPKSVLYIDLGMNNTRFNNLAENVELFVLKDIFRMAALFEVDEKVMIDLIYSQHLKNKKAKKKN